MKDRSSWPVERRLAQRIIDGDRDSLEADLDLALAENARTVDRQRHPAGWDAEEAVSDLFGAGQMQLPFVLQSAETMKASVAHLDAWNVPTTAA